MAEIGRMLGVSRRRTSQLIAKDDFPEPIAVLSVGRGWCADQVRTWATSTGRTIHSTLAP